MQPREAATSPHPRALLPDVACRDAGAISMDSSKPRSA